MLRQNVPVHDELLSDVRISFLLVFRLANQLAIITVLRENESVGYCCPHQPVLANRYSHFQK